MTQATDEALDSAAVVDGVRDEIRRAERRADSAMPQPLAFNAEFEPLYLRDRALKSLPTVRGSLILAALLYTGFAALDVKYFGLFQSAWAFIVLLGVAMGSTLALFAYTYAPKAKVGLFRVGAVVALVNGLSLSVVMALISAHGQSPPYEALSIQHIYTFFLLGLPLRYALPPALIGLAGFLVFQWIADVPVGIMARAGYLQFGTVVVGAAGCLLVERAHRMAWLNARLLKYSSDHDALTKLANRHCFAEQAALRIAQAVREHRPLSLLVFDIDHFKQVNDTYGHAAGDICLQRVANRTEQAGRRPMDVAARIGGEEFALLLFDAEPDGARVRAEDLLAGIRALDHAHGKNVTISIGVASMAAQQALSLAALMARADQALYVAKRTGRDRVCVWQPDMATDSGDT